MEYIVGIAVIAAIVYLLTRKSKEAVVETAPYKVEVPEAKVEAVNAQPVSEAKPAKAPAKKRTFVKREEGDAKAKVAKIKAPAKPKATKKPKAK